MHIALRPNCYLLALLTALFLPSTTALAQRLGSASGNTGAGLPVQVDHGPHASHSGSEVTLTHSESSDIFPDGSVACSADGFTVENSYFRVFDLSAFGLAVPLTVTDVEIGIELATETPTTVRLHRLDGPLLLANLTLVAEAVHEITSADGFSIVSVPITATFEADEVLVAEWNVPDLRPDGEVYFGGNSLGETGPTYILAVECGLTEPNDLLLPELFVHWVLNVNGTTNPVAVEAGAGAQRVTLGQAYPNPVVSRAVIPFSLEATQHVRVAVYDALGREVAVAAERTFRAGEQSVVVDVTGLPSGLYFYRVDTEGETRTRRLVVLR